MTPNGLPEKNELDEWNAIAKKGAANRRKAAVPVVAGALAFAVVFGAVFAAVSALYVAEDQDKQARIDRGERVIEVHRRGSTRETRAAGNVLFIVIAAAVAGTGAAAGAFLGLGGKLSAEYKRGFDAARR
jgi:hypothetical protein